MRLGKNLVSKARDEDNGIDYLGPDDPYDPCVNNDAGMVVDSINNQYTIYLSVFFLQVMALM